jgi:hypothetical protein
MGNFSIEIQLFHATCSSPVVGCSHQTITEKYGTIGENLAFLKVLLHGRFGAVSDFYRQ